MKTEIQIKTALELEKLHRYVFNVLYIQKYDITPEDRLVIEKYNKSYIECPDFRKTLWEEHQRTGKFKHINFQRYGFREKPDSL